MACCAARPVAKSRSFASERATRIRCVPCAASARAKAAPIPEEAPVIKAVFPAYRVVAVAILSVSSPFRMPEQQRGHRLHNGDDGQENVKELHDVDHALAPFNGNGGLRT